MALATSSCEQLAKAKGTFHGKGRLEASLQVARPCCQHEHMIRAGVIVGFFQAVASCREKGIESTKPRAAENKEDVKRLCYLRRCCQRQWPDSSCEFLFRGWL